MREIIARFDDENKTAFVYGEEVGEIIRCKDCKHTYLSDNFGITAPWLMCKRHIGNTYKVNEDDFCSLAEREEE